MKGATCEHIVKVCIKLVEGGFIIEHEEYPMGIQKTFVRTTLTDAMLTARNILTGYLEEKEGDEVDVKQHS